MKFVRCLFCIIALSLLTTACSTQYLGDAGSSGSNEPQSEADFMPVYFDSEEQFLSTIDEIKSKKSNTGAEDTALIIDSNMLGKQTYSAKKDKFDLASISEYYKPKIILKGTSLKEIHVKKEYVSYWYVNEDQIDCATFTWLREMPPEVHMNELYGRGAISEREIEHNGIKYVFLEWADPETNKSAGFSIDWVAEGKSYSASVPVGYTDEEMLAFCQFETVTVE